MQGLLPRFWREPRPNVHCKFKKKITFWPNNSMTCSHDPCTHICTNHSVPHHHLQPSPKSETLTTIQTLNAAIVSSPPSLTTTHVRIALWRLHSSRRRSSTTSLQHHIWTKIVKPPMTEPPWAKSPLRHTHQRLKP